MPQSSLAQLDCVLYIEDVSNLKTDFYNDYSYRQSSSIKKGQWHINVEDMSTGP